jgi:hypothetical protein
MTLIAIYLIVNDKLKKYNKNGNEVVLTNFEGSVSANPMVVKHNSSILICFFKNDIQRYSFRLIAYCI